jgi:hypothetical protein
MPQDLLYKPIYFASWGQHMPWRAMHFCQLCYAICNNIWYMHNASTSNMHNFCYTTPNAMIQEANLLIKTYSSCLYTHQCEGSWSQQGHHTSVTPCTHIYQTNHPWTTHEACGSSLTHKPRLHLIHPWLPLLMWPLTALRMAPAQCL